MHIKDSVSKIVMAEQFEQQSQCEFLPSDKVNEPQTDLGTAMLGNKNVQYKQTNEPIHISSCSKSNSSENR